MEISIKNNHGRIIYGDLVMGSYVKNVTINNGKVTVDGKPLKDVISKSNEKEIHIHIQGDIQRLEVDQCEHIEITGNVGRAKTNCGSFEIKGDVAGDVHTNCGSITCKNIEGDCHTNMGNINRC